MIISVKSFSEDIEKTDFLRSKMGVPNAPPNPANITAEVKKLHYTLGARYLGIASLISLKTPQEGFSHQRTLLDKVRAGYEGQGEKVFMMGKEQQAVFQAGLQSYCNFGGHGSGIHGY